MRYKLENQLIFIHFSLTRFHFINATQFASVFGDSCLVYVFFHVFISSVELNCFNSNLWNSMIATKIPNSRSATA